MDFANSSTNILSAIYRKSLQNLSIEQKHIPSAGVLGQFSALLHMYAIQDD